MPKKKLIPFFIWNSVLTKCHLKTMNEIGVRSVNNKNLSQSKRNNNIRQNSVLASGRLKKKYIFYVNSHIILTVSEVNFKRIFKRVFHYFNSRCNIAFISMDIKTWSDRCGSIHWSYRHKCISNLFKQQFNMFLNWKINNINSR